MKLSDYVADFLAKQGIRHVFAISGGASVHLIDSLAKHPNIDYICPQHEQAGAMAADAYARIKSSFGAAIATSGPGATNMVTGVCCAHYDSVPVIFITGQVATFRLKSDTGVRQLGFQETDVVDMFRPITKYAVMVEDPQMIRYHMEKACYLALHGRPGPVLVDIPDNLQRADVNPTELEPFTPAADATNKRSSLSQDQIHKCLELLSTAKRPIVVFGWGVRLAKAEKEAIAVAERLGFPVVPTWGALDMIPSSHPLFVGSFGTHGSRYGNFAIQNADVLLAVGTRLDTHETGSPLSTFSRESRKIVVDIDSAELNKFPRFGMNVDLPLNCDAKDFLAALSENLSALRSQDISEWKSTIQHWKTKYPICAASYFEEKEVNPYVFVKALADESKAGDVFVLDTGCALAWMMQGFEFKEGQRVLHAFNNTPMGYGLPASIGASLAGNRRPITLVGGDGSMQMNIQELATVARHNLPIKIFLINNHGYSMIQQTQEQWLGARYEASSVEGGLGFPDFPALAQAYGCSATTITENRGLRTRIREVLDSPGPMLCNVEIASSHRVVPQVKYGRAIEDSEPLLERAEFFKNMIVAPEKASL